MEAVGPDSAPLERLASQLRAECGLHPAKENKFAVGLRSASLEPPRRARLGGEAEPVAAAMDPATRACDFAVAALRRLHQEWQANEPVARLGEGPEPLHRLRVTARRMETVLSLFRGYLPAGLRRSRPMLKRLLDALGAVRDADVRIEAASSFRSSVPEGDRLALDPLLQHLQSERARVRSTMLRALDARHTRDWLDAVPDQLARTAPPTSSASSRSAAAALSVVPALIRERYRKLRKCARRLTPESPMGEFHKVRIRAKKLRYALEVVAATYAKPAARTLSALHKMQAKLGTQHDADVISRYLTQLASDPPASFAPATLFLMGRMAEAHARKAARMGGKVERPWRKVRRRRWKALRSRMEKSRDGVPASNNEDRSIGHSAHGSTPHGSARGNGRIPPAGLRWSWSSPHATRH